jgi:hypothetical protein
MKKFIEILSTNYSLTTEHQLLDNLHHGLPHPAAALCRHQYLRMVPTVTAGNARLWTTCIALSYIILS